MAKRSRRGLSKKGLIGLSKKRRDSDKKLVWVYQGNEYETLRQVITTHRIQLLGLNL